MENNNAKILIVEDEVDIASFIETELTYEGYQVEIAYDGMQGLMLARKNNPDLIILDRLLPKMNGIEFCKRIKQSSDVPIIMLTALDEVDDKIEGLDAGANDYLVKPFSLRELLARIRVQLRLKKPVEKTVFEFKGLSMDLSTREILRDGKQINLTPKEFELLSLLIHSPRQVFTKENIFEKVWGWDFDGEDNVLEVLMHGLREKVEIKGSPKLIHTIRGIGYTLKES
ncbi:MAG: response regulator transcription factor [Candidatus Sericytochromatia bacterium]|nr:response regulator transcription factor [Candidatus Sericytochromatia bacterium]